MALFTIDMAGLLSNRAWHTTPPSHQVLNDCHATDREPIVRAQPVSVEGTQKRNHRPSEPGNQAICEEQDGPEHDTYPEGHKAHLVYCVAPSETRTAARPAADGPVAATRMDCI